MTTQTAPQVDEPVPYALTDAGRQYHDAATAFEQADARLGAAQQELDAAQTAYTAALRDLDAATHALTEAARGSL